LCAGTAAVTDGNTEKGCQKQQKTTTTTTDDDDDDDEVCVLARRRQNEVIDPNLMIKVRGWPG